MSVQRQRAGIVQLVTDSYQNGTELNTATAMMSDEGPKGLMNRYGVVESAGDSMEARYEAFRIASAQAKTYAGKAAKAQKHQQSLAEEAKELAAEAGELAAAAVPRPTRSPPRSSSWSRPWPRPRTSPSTWPRSATRRSSGSRTRRQRRPQRPRRTPTTRP